MRALDDSGPPFNPMASGKRPGWWVGVERAAAFSCFPGTLGGASQTRDSGVSVRIFHGVTAYLYSRCGGSETE